ncbi:thioesterase [Actinomycetes bacterium]|nr:thioesterase [Actinomycetes bacterium]
MRIIRVNVERRFSDLDMLQHVNNVVYNDYLQEGRIRLMRELRTDFAEPYFPQVLARQEINYRKTLELRPEPLVVEAWISSVGRTSYEVGLRILDDDGSLAADATSVMVCFDPATQKPVPIPADYRAALVEAMEGDG